MKIISTEFKTAGIVGNLLAVFKTGVPVTVELPECKDILLPIFTTKEKLVDALQRIGITDYVIKQITDERGFLVGLFEQGIRVVRDIRATPEGNSKWTEIVYPE